ncbi:DUF3306 domain-containing protein [Aestuariibius sp. 2305UL40-4]|uniref:DUF3306 domain-containing protein n=1 Tax=Aestuariibius violaceus TaxID=3234132 RepID=UPI00345E2AEC
MSDFWARRKAAVAAQEQAEDAARVAEARAAEQAGKTDEELLAELELPDPDTLEPGDNIAAFMKEAVPEHLRRRALRALWKTNPVLANVDGLVDYGGDFTDSAMVVENMQTAYQVGKGMLRHVLELEAPANDAEAPVEEVAELDEESPTETVVIEEPQAVEVVSEAPIEEDEEILTLRPRRMSFSFGSEGT